MKQIATWEKRWSFLTVATGSRKATLTMNLHIFSYGLPLVLCGLLTAAEICQGNPGESLERGTLEANSHIYPFHQGVATFEVSDTGATVWARIKGHAQVEVRLFEEKSHSETRLQGTYLMPI